MDTQPLNEYLDNQEISAAHKLLDRECDGMRVDELKAFSVGAKIAASAMLQNDKVVGAHAVSAILVALDQRILEETILAATSEVSIPSDLIAEITADLEQ